ncbi:MAG: ABC transporter substrate-binding protein [Bdellovibrionales bacterium]|nr:ABC transporter substrate-binding protein [Bdellovibrionales bacterium]
MKLLILASLILSGPLQAATTIQFWHSMSGPKAKVIDQLVADFNARAENKGKAEVVAQYVGSYPEGVNKLRTALIGNRGPHVAQIYDIGTQVMIDSNAVVPLHEFTSKDPSFAAEQLLPQIRRYYEVAGKLYSLPFATSNPIIYYNVDAFEKAGLKSPPKTFAELQMACPKLTDAKKQKTCITWPLHAWFFEEFVARQGGELLFPANGRTARAEKALYSEPPGQRFVSLWKTLVDKGEFANVGRGWQPANHNFLADRSAMMITSTSDVFEITNKASFRVMTAPLFTFDPAVPGGTVVGGNSLWILKRKQKEEEQLAYSFVRFMASPSVQESWHRNTGYFPIRQDVIDSLKAKGFYKKYPGAWTAIEQLRSSAEIPATQGALMGVFPQAREYIESAVEEVLAGQKAVEKALKDAEDRTNKALERYNRLKQHG